MTSMEEMIQKLINERAALWESSKHYWDERGDVADADVPAATAAYERITALDAHLEELHEIHQRNLKADAYRSPFEAQIRPDVADALKESRMSEQFTGPGYKAPYMNTGQARNMSDEEVFWRSWLTGKEPQRIIEISFDEFSHVVDPDTGKLAYRFNGEPFEARDLLTTTGSSAMVTTDIRSQIYRHLVERNALLRNGATVINTPDGNALKIPKSIAAGTATIVGEGSAISENDPTFSSVTLDAWKVSQFLQISNEMIEDTRTDLLSYIAFDMGRALGQTSGAQFITGSGTNQPRGLITATANDVGTAVQIASATISGDNIVDLFYSVSTPYRERGRWLMNATTAGVLRKLKAPGSGDYLWQPDFANGQPDNLLGRPVVIDPAVANIASANLSVAFGDFAAYHIRQAPVRLERSDDFAFDRDVASFRAVLRTDGDLVDATGAVRVLDTD